MAYGKANPGKLNFATAGVGTTPDLAASRGSLRTGIDAVHRACNAASAPSTTDMISNKVQMSFSSIAGALPFTSDGRVIALVTTGSVRSGVVYPDLPTVAEAGPPGYDVDLRLGLYGTGGTPPAVLEKLNAAIAKALQDPETQDVVREIRPDAARHVARGQRAFTKSEYEKWEGHRRRPTAD